MRCIQCCLIIHYYVTGVTLGVDIFYAHPVHCVYVLCCWCVCGHKTDDETVQEYAVRGSSDQLCIIYRVQMTC